MSPQTKSRFSFNGYIWKMAANKAHTLLVLELREEAVRKTSFVAIDLKSKNRLWEQDKLHEKWWIGLKEVTEEGVVLTGFKDARNPESQGIYVLSGKDGTLLWENKSFTAVGNFKNYLLARESDEKVYVLNLMTGEVEKEIAGDDYLPLLSNSASDNLILNGKHYRDDNPHFPKVASFIESLTGHTAVKTVEYLEAEGKIIASFYSLHEEKMVNYLLVSDEVGNVVLNEVIAENIDAIAFESYFVMEGSLFFIKNRKELIIFELKSGI